MGRKRELVSRRIFSEITSEIRVDSRSEVHTIESGYCQNGAFNDNRASTMTN